ncbi:MAG TPA: hypothetical protein VMU19_00635 [Bryobacteraceae bacterium]|nr:hypothetical protein [Bryobacteraceae bacterium]
MEPGEQRASRRTHAAWYAATALSLAANAYLLFITHDMANSAADERQTISAQIASLDRKTAEVSRDSAQHIDSVSEEASAAIQQAEADSRRANAKLSSSLAARDAEQKKFANDFTALKAEEDSSSAKLDQVSGDVQSVKGDVTTVRADVDSTKSELEGHGTELKSVRGDMGVMSGLIATNAKELAQLRALGDRNYFQFDIKKSGEGQKISDVRLTLRKTDPKRNRFTLDVLANDKLTEKRDRTIDEPIQFYVTGGRQPYEIVVNTVNKDEIAGYLATPKTQVAER